jgi:hypothetical protein
MEGKAGEGEFKMYRLKKADIGTYCYFPIYNFIIGEINLGDKIGREGKGERSLLV